MKNKLSAILGRLFKSQQETSNDDSQSQTAPGYASFNATGKTMDMGNTIFHGEYEEAIRMGLEELEKYPTDPMVHINLMVAYFKARDISPDYFAKSTEHARLAMLYGHHTGYAEQRLAINLEKEHKYHQALQLYSIILDTPGFHFSPHGCGHGIDFESRRQKTLLKITKASDTEDDRLFSNDEIKQMIIDIAKADKLEEERRASEKWDIDEFVKELLKMK